MLKAIKWTAISIFGLWLIGTLAGGGHKSNAPSGNASSNSSYSSKPAARTKTFAESVNEKVISDAEEEYSMARSGVDRCVHAGMVAAAYLQAHDEFGYRQWKLREDNDCRY